MTQCSHCLCILCHSSQWIKGKVTINCQSLLLRSQLLDMYIIYSHSIMLQISSWKLDCIILLSLYSHAATFTHKAIFPKGKELKICTHPHYTRWYVFNRHVNHTIKKIPLSQFHCKGSVSSLWFSIYFTPLEEHWNMLYFNR